MEDAMFKDPQVFRWVLDLLEYDYTIVHIKGHHNCVADCLSRLVKNPWIPLVRSSSKADQDWLGQQVEVGASVASITNESRGVEVDLPYKVCCRVDGARTMLICENCLQGVHLGCLPPDERLNGILKGNWYCNECRPRGPAPGIGHEEFELLQRLATSSPTLMFHDSDPLLDKGFCNFLHLLRWAPQQIPNLHLPDMVSRNWL
jgi:hypothetical protein